MRDGIKGREYEKRKLKDYDGYETKEIEEEGGERYTKREKRGVTEIEV